MGLKALKDYGLKFKEVKAMVTLMNDSKLAEPVVVKVGMTGEEILSSFITAVDSVPDDRTGDIPAEVQKYYNALPQEVFSDDDSGAGVGPDEKRAATTPKVSKEQKVVEKDDAPVTTPENTPEEVVTFDADLEAAQEASTEAIVESECPTFKKGWDPNEADCQECATDYPDEYAYCEKASKEAKGATTKTGKKAGKKKVEGAATTEKKAPGKRSRYGHMPTSMAGRIDNMVYAGGTKESMVKTLMTEFKRDEAKATNKLNSHLLCLLNQKGITIKETDGVLKAVEEFTTGQNAENTEV